MALDDSILVRASDAQWEETLRRQVLIWSQPVSEDNFMRREHKLRRSKYAEEKSWMCCCETYRKPCLYRVDGYDSTTLEGSIYAIASVLTPPRHQRKGYAHKMMKLLHTKLGINLGPSEADESLLPEEYGHNDGIASVLFSDVGDFYSTCPSPNGEAWQISNPRQVTWNVATLLLEEDEPTSCTMLTEDEVEKVSRADLLNTILSMRPGSLQSVYNAQDIDWHMIRARSMWEHFQPLRNLPKIEHVGAQMETSSSKSFAFILWMPDYSKEELKILRLAASTSSQAEVLLEAAAQFAKEHQLTNIVAWNPDPELLRGTDWKVEERSHSLPAIAWYDAYVPFPGKTTAKICVSELKETVSWFPEYYAWC